MMNYAHQLDRLNKFQEQTGYTFSDEMASNILSGRIVVEPPRDPRAPLSADAANLGVRRGTIAPRIYSINPRTKQRTLLGTATPEQVAGLANRTQTSQDREMTRLERELERRMALRTNATYIARKSDDPIKVQNEARLEILMRTLANNDAQTGVIAAGTGTPQAATRETQTAPAVTPSSPVAAQRPQPGSSGFTGMAATTPAQVTPKQRVAGWITQYGVTTDILTRVMDNPAIIDALTRGDTQHARTAAIAEARVRIQDPEQRRQAVDAITHFMDYLESETGGR
jgi:hypothetical protein